MEARPISARSSNSPGWEGSRPSRIVTRSRGLPMPTTISKRGKYGVVRFAFRKGQRRNQDLLKSCQQVSSVARMEGNSDYESGRSDQGYDRPERARYPR